MRNKAQKIYDINEAREKIRAFCVYRERSQYEVREKLESYGLLTLACDELIVELIRENYLNEERFARAFVRGKFGIKKWGRNKIRQELYRHQLSGYVLKKAFSEIDDQKYLQTLEEIIEKKLTGSRIKNPFQKNARAAAYAISRGFEPELVWDVIRTLEG